MKRALCFLLFGFTAALTLPAAPLHVVSYLGTCGPCGLCDGFPGPFTDGTFTLPIASGSGKVESSIFNLVSVIPSAPIHGRLFFYTVDLSTMTSPTNHCVRFSVRFGSPASCDWDADGVPDQVVVRTAGVSVFSAEQSGDIVTITFGTGCLAVGQKTATFGLISDRSSVTNTVTVIDNLNGADTFRSVQALVPNVPPLTFISRFPIFQGRLRPVLNNLPLNGTFDFRMLLYNDPGSNGLPVSELSTQAVSVVDGLFTVPLTFEPNTFHTEGRWLSVQVRSNGTGQFTALSSLLPISPSPQSLFANSAAYADIAGTVSSLNATQAVTSLNTLQGAITLSPGQGISFSTQGNTITISAQGGSDRARKTDFASIDPSTVLARLSRLPVQAWRYTNEAPGIVHLGPMAQDFKAAFGLGNDDTWINPLDEGGVALSAVQALNQKLELELKRREAENAELMRTITELRKAMEVLSQQVNGSAR